MLAEDAVMVESIPAVDTAPITPIGAASQPDVASRELQQLATELHRPPQSLTALSHLSAEHLTWLSARVAEVCQREDTEMRIALHRALPRLLRPLLLRRLRSAP